MSKFNWFTRSILQVAFVLVVGSMARADDPTYFTDPVPSAPAWHKVPGRAIDISVSRNNVVHILGTDRAYGGYAIYELNRGNWHQIPNGGGVRIATSPNGEPWVVNDRHEIYHLHSGKWRKLPGYASEIAVDEDGRPWIISTEEVNGGGRVCRWNNGRWEPTDGGAMRIAIDGRGVVWVVNTRHEIYYLTRGGWARTHGTATDIGVSADGSLFIVGIVQCDGGRMIYQRVRNKWEELNRGGFKLSGGVGNHVWTVNSRHEIWTRYQDI